MLSFAIIAEGITDQYVIQNCLLGYFGDEITVHFREPPRDANNPGAHAGWPLVLQHLRTGRVGQALAVNDVVIIHIDTDKQEEKGFDVPRRDGGRELTAEERIERVRRRLIAEMQPPINCADAARVLFAIAVDSIECWLLPLLADKKQAKETKNCQKRASHALTKKKQPGLVNKKPAAYDAASDEYTDRDTLLEKGPLNVSLGVFLGELEALQKRLPAPDA